MRFVPSGSGRVPAASAFFLIAALLYAPAAFPAPAAGPKSASKEPIHITSDRMEADNQKRVIVFIGKVDARQGDMEIQSDRLQVFIKKPPKEEKGKASQRSADAKGKDKTDISSQDASSSVERLVATGNVLLNQAEKKFAAGERLDYNQDTGVAVLTGNPRAWEGNNQVVGSKIEIFLKEDKTIVHGTNTRRVNVTLYPGAEQTPPPGGKGNPKAKQKTK